MSIWSVFIDINNVGYVAVECGAAYWESRRRRRHDDCLRTLRLHTKREFCWVILPFHLSPFIATYFAPSRRMKMAMISRIWEANKPLLSLQRERKSLCVMMTMPLYQMYRNHKMLCESICSFVHEKIADKGNQWETNTGIVFRQKILYLICTA